MLFDGTLMRRRDGGAGRGALGWRQTQPSAPGRRRTPPGHTRVPREELADGVSFGRLAESADRTPSNAAMERREARTPVTVCALAKRTRRSALHPLGLSGGHTKGPGNGAGTTAYPGPLKNTGDDARLGGLLAARRDMHRRLENARCADQGILAISARFPGRGEAPSKRPSSTLLCRRERFFRLPYQNRS